MSKEKSKNYIYEDGFLRCELFNSEFTEDKYKEFDLNSTKLGLRSKIDNLIAGKKVNFTEDQAALHPLCRKKNDFLEDHSLASFMTHAHNAQNIVTIGIGGSYEGPKLLVESLGHYEKLSEYKHYFVTGSDSVEFEEKVRFLDPKKTIFIVSSKSFTTDETIKIFKEAMKWSGNMNNFLAITANKSEALKYNLKYIAEFDNEIGGRYSLWSKISFQAAFFALPTNGEDTFKNFCSGGAQADKYLNNNKEYIEFIKMLSFSDIWFNNIKNKNSRAILSYIWKLRSLPDYFQQLEMESLGKRPHKDSGFKNTGQIIFGGYGPKAQHSYFQLLHQGSQNICVDIIANKEDPESLAYAQALTQAKLLSQGAGDLLDDKEKINGNVPVNLFTLNGINAKKLGFLIATWEHRVFITSVMLQINAFDQFGVNAGKIYTNNLLSRKV